MNKGGFLRLIESIIAVTIVITVMFIYFNKSKEIKEPDISERARAILEEVAKNNTLRYEILNSQTSNLNNFIRAKIPESYLDFEIKICILTDACGKSSYTPGNIYSAERTISSTLTISPNNAKKVRLFIWEKQ